jgi:hypothetical protein
MQDNAFLGACAKLEKAAISFVMWVRLCLSVRPHGTTRFLLDGSSWNFTFEYFRKIPQQNSTYIKFLTILKSIFIYDIISLNYLTKEMFHRAWHKSKTYVLCSKSFLRNSCLLRDNVEKCGTAWLVTDDSIIRRLRIDCWLNKAIVKHSEYVIILVYAQESWLREGTSMLRL